MTHDGPYKNLENNQANSIICPPVTNKGSDMMQVTQTLKELSMGISLAISPNVNWHNPLHIGKFKQPLQHMYKWINLSATSSDVWHLPAYLQQETHIGQIAISTFDHLAPEWWKLTLTPVTTEPSLLLHLKYDKGGF